MLAINQDRGFQLRIKYQSVERFSIAAAHRVHESTATRLKLIGRPVNELIASIPSAVIGDSIRILLVPTVESAEIQYSIPLEGWWSNPRVITDTVIEGTASGAIELVITLLPESSIHTSVEPVPDSYELPYDLFDLGNAEYISDWVESVSVSELIMTELERDEVEYEDEYFTRGNLYTPIKEEYVSPATDYTLWYATNREAIVNEGQVKFSAKRTSTTLYGTCVVHIPEGHITGKVESGLIRRQWRKLTNRPDDQALQLVKTEALQADVYWASIKAEVKRWQEDERCGVVFLHGYNVSFEEAAIRAAQIGYDLDIQGPVGFFSWPSSGALLGYLYDDAAISGSEVAISEYLQEFARNCGAERVHVIAHSMGNLLLLRALQRIAESTKDNTKMFHHFILAAPDVDKGLFESLAQNYDRVAHHTTLYISHKDRALRLASILRGGTPRVGLAPPYTVVSNVDTIHVGNVDMSQLGHGYLAEARLVINDIHQVLFQDVLPSKRAGLSPKLSAEGLQYWFIKA
ncbi:alpha/beta hydrolase [Hymenobacter sp. GOD-10R]|uniref:alpha/beta hydrolase n=1 Tax=Hymenobacter sp. GOD-10R TaxID=3093922 RepID=UPI002D7991C6|nr:alpha/beta hydrolase [Hymenobacter sp. GOD-10R]WRQ31820.1 alpha/beta hydrolase [Hymenobacter sp. GOD-10R]